MRLRLSFINTVCDLRLSVIRLLDTWQIVTRYYRHVGTGTCTSERADRIDDDDLWDNNKYHISVFLWLHRTTLVHRDSCYSAACSCYKRFS